MKNKKTTIIIITLFIILALAIFLFYILTSKTKEQTDAQRFKQEYENLNNTKREKDGKTIRSITVPQNNPMIYSNESKIIEKIKNKDTFLVYFGFTDCPWCRSVINNLIEAATDLNLDEIYYVNVKEIRDTIEIKDNSQVTTKKGTTGYYELLKLLDNVLDDYIITDNEGNEISTNEKRIFAPNVIAIVDGKAEQITDGISKKQTNGYMKLTSTMNKESYNKFKCLINCLTKEEKTCAKDKAC